MSKNRVKKTVSGGFILQKGPFGLWLGRSSGKCFSTQSGLRIRFGVRKRDFGVRFWGAWILRSWVRIWEVRILRILGGPLRIWQDLRIWQESWDFREIPGFPRFRRFSRFSVILRIWLDSEDLAGFGRSGSEVWILRIWLDSEVWILRIWHGF